ncbi:chemotaxis protein CheV [Geomicrobium sp. JCM 19038]|uniref:chemotaxis protein CheV n=1 Tax=Geomicrobium sp. JCM 19038 TaxID=1460635 RepID=UPI00045F4CD4|nr:chemotaxis protein [Geomicrobium sp. JCM 19038]GAK09070.1 chemotaxis protein CheV [Geomicrobium sp. JCM 19038]
MSSFFDETDYENEDLNEFEVMVYRANAIHLAINILKIREIITVQPITPTPNRHHFVEGVIQVREETIPVIDVGKVLDLPTQNNDQTKMMIVEINELTMALFIEDVDRIVRVNWSNVHNADEIAAGSEAQATGTFMLEDKSIFLLDYEKMIMDIVSESSLSDNDTQRYVSEREQKVVVAIEDSKTMLAVLRSQLISAGYRNVQYFDDGRKAFDALQQLNYCDLIVTDLEMPGLTGHQLTKYVRDDRNYKAVPIVLFSAIESENVVERNDEVGVSAQVTKPNYEQLIRVMDHHANVKA